jgi:oxygen-independent coproporphyrinogen-3 oxidase
MSPVAWSSVVDAEAEMGEMLYLGLRLNRGLDWEEVRRACRSDRLVDCESALKEMAGIGLVEWQGNRVRLTRRGMLLSNEVFQQFVQPWADH